MRKRIPVRTLVIDDDPSVCRAIKTWLTEASHEVLTFTRAGEGLDAARTTTCQIALVDLRLPDAEGASVITELASSGTPSRVVALSAFPDIPQVLQAMRAGARDVLSKPVQRDPLLAAVDRQLAELGVSGHTEEEFNRRLGRRLRALRLERELTLAEVAERVGVTAAQLSQLELGKNATTTWTLARIASALHCPLRRVFEGV